MNKFHWLLSAVIPFLITGTPKNERIIEKESPTTYYNRVVEFRPQGAPSCYKFIRTKEIFSEGWDNLQQPKFWREIMNLPAELSIINVGTTRETLGMFPTREYDRLSTSGKAAFKDSVRRANGYDAGTNILLTEGKSHYYLLKETLPYIGAGVDAFISEGTDPWYAQAILLIESPGASRTSGAGASGHFQLMKDVAISMGLTVNKYVDERHDFDKGARGSARLLQRVCIPETKRMLDAKGIYYNPSDLWFRLLVLHVYHAGAGNVRGAINEINPSAGGKWLIEKLWTTSHGGFKNASQNYSQLALAALSEVEAMYLHKGAQLCDARDVEFY